MNSNGKKAEQFEAEAFEHRAVFAQFFGIDEEGEVEAKETVRIDQAGGLFAVVARCAAAGEEADLLDAVGFVAGRVVNDGSIEWRA